MNAVETAEATAAGISDIGSRFMLDPATYQRGAALGFPGAHFYTAGRGGVLGDTDGDVVAAAFVFFEPHHVRRQWEETREVAPRAVAAEEFAACCHRWAEEHVPDDIDVARTAELAGRVVVQASASAAPLFAGWRRLPTPAAPKALAVHQLNALRELRGAMHGAAVLTAGLRPVEALAVKTPQMAPVFGWTELPAVEHLRDRWAAADAATNAAMAAAFEPLEEAERSELAELIQALNAATGG